MNRPSTQPRQLLLALLVSAAIIVDFAVVRALGTYPSLAGPMIGIALAQLSLLVVWTIFGEAYLLLRLACLPGALSLLAAAVSQSKPGFAEWIAAFWLFSFCVGAPLTAMRWMGLRLLARPTEPLPPPEIRHRHLQFSLRTLLASTTGVACVLAVLRLAQFPWDHAAVVTAYIVGFAFVSLACIAATLAARRASPAAALALAASVAAGYLMDQLERDTTVWVIGAAVFEAAFVLLGGVVLRVSQLRFVRTIRSRPAAP